MAEAMTRTSQAAKHIDKACQSITSKVVCFVNKHMFKTLHNCCNTYWFHSSKVGPIGGGHRIFIYNIFIYLYI